MGDAKVMMIKCTVGIKTRNINKLCNFKLGVISEGVFVKETTIEPRVDF